LLFSELFEGQTWTYAGIALRRIHKDRRARKFLGSLLGKLLFIPSLLLAVLASFAAITLAPIGIATFGIVIGFAFRFAIRAVRSESKYWASVNTTDVAPEPARMNLLRTAYWLAVLFRRLDSEIYLQKEIPPEIQIITRRVLLDRLRANGIWEEMPAAVHDLLLKPDGHWTAEERESVWTRFEYFSCLRWVVRKDTFLPWLSLFPRYDLRKARETIDDPNWFSEKHVVSPARIEEHGKIAVGYVNRCWLEGVARNLVPSDPEQNARAVEEKKRFDPKSDFLLGDKTVGLLRDDLLRHLFRRAQFRATILRAAQNEMTSTPDKGALQNLMEESFAALSRNQTTS
jgi:hypothetical protein